MKETFQPTRSALLLPTRGHRAVLALACFLCAGPGSTLGQTAEEKKPLIAVMATGGIIANTRSGYIPFNQVIADIRSRFPETAHLLDGVRFKVTNLTRVGSQDFTSKHFLDIARTVNKVIQEPDVTGVIVTQGTYTSEETAYFLHLLVHSSKPLVLTNSQRRHGTVSNDGDKNFLDAVRVVLSPEATGKGALVVANETINSGREVLKTSSRPGAFISEIHGVLGIVQPDKIIFYRAPTRRHTIHSEFDVNQITRLPKVEVISAYYDADPGLIRAAADLGVKGIVINGFTTRGTPHRGQQPILEDLAQKGISIVRTARGGTDNRVAVETRDRFIEGDSLVPHKASILLQIALTKTSDPGEIQRIFDEY